MATVTRAMRCPPQAVLDVLSDGWTYATWVVGTSRLRSVDARLPRARGPRSPTRSACGRR